MGLFKDRSFMIYILLVFCNFNLFGQEQLNLDYSSFLERQIEEKYNTKYFYVNDIKNDHINLDSVYMLIISDKKEMDYFVDNINHFSNLEKLYIYRVKLNDFTFLNHLEKIRIISLVQNRKINFESLVNTLNKKPRIKHLYITNKRLSNLPDQINQLINLKSLGVIGTKIKEIEINLNLYYLDLSSNKKIDYSSIKVMFSEIINLGDNEIKYFPAILGKSNTLRSLIFSQSSLMKLNCPVKGFSNLEILDIFSTNTNGIKKSCFKEAEKLEIIQQIR